jgi:hypothetical protein
MKYSNIPSKKQLSLIQREIITHSFYGYITKWNNFYTVKYDSNVFPMREFIVILDKNYNIWNIFDGIDYLPDMISRHNTDNSLIDKLYYSKTFNVNDCMKEDDQDQIIFYTSELKVLNNGLIFPISTPWPEEENDHIAHVVVTDIHGDDYEVTNTGITKKRWKTSQKY